MKAIGIVSLMFCAATMLSACTGPCDKPVENSQPEVRSSGKLIPLRDKPIPLRTTNAGMTGNTSQIGVAGINGKHMNLSAISFTSVSATSGDGEALPWVLEPLTASKYGPLVIIKVDSTGATKSVVVRAEITYKKDKFILTADFAQVESGHWKGDWKEVASRIEPRPAENVDKGKP